MSKKGRPIHEMLAAVNAVEGAPQRTAKAIECRLRTLGLPSSSWGWTSEALRRMFGVTPSVAYRWLSTGILKGTRSGLGGYNKGTPWVVSDEDLDVFLRQERWRYDWRKITDPRIRSRAEVYDRVDPWITVQEAATMLGISKRQLYDDPWRSRFAHHRRDVKTKMAGSTPRVYLRSEILAYLRKPDARSEENTRRQAHRKGKPRKDGRLTRLLDIIAARVA